MGLRELLQPFEGDRPGVAAGVVRRGGIVAMDAVGLARLDPAVAMTPQTVCYMASVSKQFTAACVGEAVRQHRLDVRAPIRLLLPELPPWAEAITVDDLLHHTSGIRDYLTVALLEGHGARERSEGGPPGAKQDRVVGPARLLDRLARWETAGSPSRRRYSYSNTNYALAALVVERACDTGFAEYAEDVLFRPLGMTSTRFLLGPSPEAGALGYESGASGWEERDPVIRLFGGGGLRSNVEDLLRWGSALMGGEVHPEVVAFLGEPGWLDDGTELGYCRGLARGRMGAAPPGSREEGERQAVSVEVLGHGGALGPWRTQTLWVVVEDVFAVAVANGPDVTPGLIARSAARQILGWDRDEPARPSDGVGADKARPKPAIARSGAAPCRYPRVRSTVDDRFLGCWVDPLDGASLVVEGLPNGHALVSGLISAEFTGLAGGEDGGESMAGGQGEGVGDGEGVGHRASAYECRAVARDADWDLVLRRSPTGTGIILEARFEGYHHRFLDPALPWTPSGLEELTGNYRCDELDTTWQLTGQGGSLRVERNGEVLSFSGLPQVRFLPLSADRFGADLTQKLFHEPGRIDGSLTLLRAGERVTGFRVDVTGAQAFTFRRLPTQQYDIREGPLSSPPA